MSILKAHILSESESAFLHWNSSGYQRPCIWLRRTVAVARPPTARKYGVSLRLRRFHYMRDLIRRNLAGTIDGNERLVYYAIRRYFSRRLVTIPRRNDTKNGERLALRVELKNGCLFLPTLFAFVHSSRTLSHAAKCNEQCKYLVYKRYILLSSSRFHFSFTTKYFFFVYNLSVNSTPNNERQW